MGINRATSTSKSRNKIATSQNLGQNGTVIIPEGSNPHSNGAAALLGRDAKPLLKQGTTTTNTAATKPITPPNLLGIARRTVYANRKYHSGTICGGVTRGSAGLKLSTSPSSHGAHITRNKRRLIAGIAPMISFQVKYGWK